MIIVYKMVKYIDISTKNIPPLAYYPVQDTTLVSGNLAVMKNLTLNAVGVNGGGGSIGLNDNVLKLRGLTDSYHTIAYSSASNGPSIQGYNGGRCGASTGIPNVIEWSASGATINGSLSVSGATTFNTNLPTSTITPTTSTQLTTKAYVDGVSAGLLSLSGTNAWTGTNSFNTNLPTSTSTPSSSTQLTTKAYVDSVSASSLSLSGTNAWTGTNSFNTNLPTSTSTPSSSTQLTTKAYVDSAIGGVGIGISYTYPNNTNSFTSNIAIDSGKKIFLRGASDPNHYVGYHVDTDGPTIQGYTGGRLGTSSQYGRTDMLVWNTSGTGPSNTVNNVSINGNTVITGNTTISKQLILTNNQTSTNNIQLNQNVLYLGALGDSSHTISYNGAINGPSIQGWNGVYLGSTQSATNNILKVYGGNGPSTNMVTVNGGFTVTGASTLTGSLICNQVYESTTATTGTTSPFTVDMATGSTFYIPTDYTFASNFQLIITNVPTDTSKTYTISVIYRQPTTLFYISTARVSDTATTYILGTSSTFSAPSFNGGVPTLANTPNLIVQSFSIISTATSSSTFSRYVTTSVNNHY
jgi:hypothetical protein